MRKQRLLTAMLLSMAIFTSGCGLLPLEDITYGLYYDDTNVSGYSRNDLRALVQKDADKTIQIDIKLSKDKTTTATAKDLGITLDIDRTVEQISSYGYESTYKELLEHRYTAFTEGVHFKPIYRFDEVKARSYISELAKQVDSPGHNASLTINNGQVVLTPSKEGIRIDIDATISALKNQVQNYNFKSLELVYTTKNTVGVSDNDLKPLTRILGSYTTYFDPSDENRTHNIEIASNKINGSLIKPGGVFSFNEIVGERTAEAGFDDAPVMIDGKLVPGIGGGICQVSSTLFNTALESGMEIVERTPHFKPVGYIPAGRDATVAYGYLDFQFKNSYANSIYVLSQMDGNALTIYIIGTPQDEPKSVNITVADNKELPNKTITKIDPTIKEDTVQEGNVGYKMNTYRRIAYGNGSSSTDVYESIYDPVDTIITKKSAPTDSSTAKPKKVS